MTYASQPGIDALTEYLQEITKPIRMVRTQGQPAS